MNPRRLTAGALVILGVTLGAAQLVAQGRRPVPLTAQDLGNGVHMLVGAGGNLGVSAGDDGVILIDDQFAWQTEEIDKAIDKISEAPVKFVINTHFHGDHTGGNENFGKAGAIIVAHDNVRKRMTAEQFQETLQRRTPASPDAALPVITFSDTATFHVNGDTVRVIRMDPAHTDGDAIVHFENANVLHMGDLFMNGRYPFVDVSCGGSVHGILAAADKALAMCDDETQIIPGHGDLATPDDLRAFREMLQGVVDAIGKLVDEGKTLEEVLELAPTKPWDEKWSNRFMNPPIFTQLIYLSLAADRDE